MLVLVFCYTLSIHVYSEYTKNSLKLHVKCPIIIITGIFFLACFSGIQKFKRERCDQNKKGF